MSGNTQSSNLPNRKVLMHFFSVDSEANLSESLPTPTQPVYNFYRKDFGLKIAQLTTGIICVILYTKGATISKETLPYVCFPHVVFGSFIIITSVIIMSFIFGQTMPDIVTRAFLSIGMILYFISATISTTVWTSMKSFQVNNLLLVQAILSYLNCFFYGVDLFLNIKQAVVFEV